MNASTLEDSHTIHLDLMALREALFMDSNGTTCNDRTELNSQMNAFAAQWIQSAYCHPYSLTKRLDGIPTSEISIVLFGLLQYLCNVVALPVIGCHNEPSFQDKRHVRHPNYEFGARVRHFLLSKRSTRSLLEWPHTRTLLQKYMEPTLMSEQSKLLGRDQRRPVLNRINFEVSPVRLTSATLPTTAQYVIMGLYEIPPLRPAYKNA